MINISNEDIEKIKKFIAIRDAGKIISGNEVTAVLNRVKGVYLSSTNCGSCIRQRIGELERYLNAFLAATAIENEKAEDVPQQPKEEPTELENKPKRGRKKKSE